MALEDFVLLTKTAFKYDRDYLFQRLVEAHSSNADKLYDIWDYIEEEQHIPSKQLISEMTRILEENGLHVPDAMKESHINQ